MRIKVFKTSLQKVMLCLKGLCVICIMEFQIAYWLLVRLSSCGSRSVNSSLVQIKFICSIWGSILFILWVILLAEVHNGFLDYWFQKPQLYNCHNFSKGPGKKWGSNLHGNNCGWLRCNHPQAVFHLLLCQLWVWPVQLLHFCFSAGLTRLV